MRGGFVFEDPFEAARKSVEELRRQGAELLVCLSHTGYDEARGPTNDTALADLGIFDAVFSGHAHFVPRRMEMLKRCNGACLLHPGVHDGQAVVWARFGLQRSPGRELSVCVAREGGADLIDDAYEQEPGMAGWLQSYADQFNALLNQDVGSCVGLTKSYPEAPLPVINWIYQSSLARALLEAFQDSGAQFAGINSAGVRADIPHGAIQYRHVEACWPWQNNVHLCECSGHVLMEMLERNAQKMVLGSDDGMFLHFAGIEYEVREGAPERVLVAGMPWSATEWYTFVGDGYLVTSALSDYRHAAQGHRKVTDCGIKTQECILNHVKALHAQGRAFGEPLHAHRPVQ